MPTSPKRKILWALLEAMKPLARLMIRNGVNYKEFSSLFKQAIVEVATNDYGLRGRPTNVSRVAVMTGLTRKEVKKIREIGTENVDGLSTKRNSQAEILHYWHTDKKYLRQDGQPLELNFDGPGATFSTLCRTYAGDIPPGAMRVELKRVGSVTENTDGTLKVNRRDFVPADYDDRLVEGLSSSLSNLASTVAFNSDPNGSGETRFEKCIDNSRIDKRKLPLLREQLTSRLMKIAIELDDEFSRYEVDTRDSGAGHEREIGVGIYFFERE